jgi:hypothetical protein
MNPLSSAPTPVPATAPSPTVPALIPLSLLEAIRNLDTPVEDGLEELAEEIVVRRLGLSPTVAAQIQRYRQTADRSGGVELDEVVSVLRLVGRRPDARLVFADAGRRAARYSARAGAGSARTFARVSPSRLRERISIRACARLAREFFRGDLRARAGTTEVRMSDSLSILAHPDGAACAYYGSAYGELLRLLGGFEGAMVHERCQARGDEACLWRSVAAEVYE